MARAWLKTVATLALGIFFSLAPTPSSQDQASSWVGLSLSKWADPGDLNGAEGGRITAFLLQGDQALLSFLPTPVSEGLGAEPLMERVQ